MTATLKFIPRSTLGSRSARVLRLQGRVPASLQGGGKDHLQLSIDDHEFRAARRHHEHVFSLEGDDGTAETAMVNELQWDALGEQIIHVEFRRVDLTQETESDVMLEFVGHPKGGVLNHLISEVTVAAIPSKIPDLIEVKVDAMELGHPLYARDLALPEGVRLVTPPGTPVAVVVVVKEEAATPAAGATPAEGEAAPAAAAAPAPAAAPAKGAKKE